MTWDLNDIHIRITRLEVKIDNLEVQLDNVYNKIKKLYLLLVLAFVLREQ